MVVNSRFTSLSVSRFHYVRQLDTPTKIVSVPTESVSDSFKLIQLQVSIRQLYSALSRSVADPGCLSRIPDPIFSIPDTGSWVDQIPDTDPHQKTQKLILSSQDPGFFYSRSFPTKSTRKLSVSLKSRRLQIICMLCLCSTNLCQFAT